MATVAQPHLDRERVGRRLQVVAEDAVERGEHRLALGPGCPLAEQRRELGEGAVDAGAHQPCHAPDAPVDRPGEEAGGARERAAEEVGPGADVVVHRLDQVGHAPGRLDRQPARTPQIIDGAARLPRHRLADGGWRAPHDCRTTSVPCRSTSRVARSDPATRSSIAARAAAPICWVGCLRVVRGVASRAA